MQSLLPLIRVLVTNRTKNKVESKMQKEKKAF